MKLIYLDESGNTGTKVDDKLQPYHLLAALVIDEFQVRHIENDVRMLGLKHFGNVSQNTDFEFHGYEIHKGKGRYFSRLQVDRRIEIMEDLLNVVKNNNLQILYTVIDKAKNNAKLHPHQLAFLLLVERIEDYLISQNSLDLLVADENRDIEQRLIDDLERFKTIDTGFGYRPTKAEHIIDSIHFVKSNNNHLIQLVDVVAFTLLRGKKVRKDLMDAYSAQRTASEHNLSFNEWFEENGTLRQKVELKHLSMLSAPVYSKIFPANADIY